MAGWRHVLPEDASCGPGRGGPSFAASQYAGEAKIVNPADDLIRSVAIP